MITGKLLFATCWDKSVTRIKQRGGDEMLIRVTEKALWLILLIIIVLTLTK